uniref:Uncharacterized protein n=1 Tax=Calidris pygmaea TaxID=425635 RepID=A0A8C3K0W7_9CHAR
EKFPEDPESSRLAFVLENVLARKTRIWKVPVLQNLALMVFSPALSGSA